MFNKPVLQVKFEESFSSYFDEYPEVVLVSNLQNLIDNIITLSIDEPLKNNLIKNGSK